jgi:NAD(P)-dependent dehydrogenase (short-subunit alcohol dehydrogenase family)
MTSRTNLRGKTALVTGGSGGIGRVVAAHLVARGAAVCILGSKRERLSSALKELKSAGVDGILGQCCDVSDRVSVHRAVKRAAARLGGLDILVNAAGIQAPIGAFASTDIREWERNLQVNLLGTVYFCKAAIPFLEQRKGGAIINFSGGGATSSRANFSAYAVAKAGVVRFTEVLAEELQEKHIRVNAVAPGAVNTGMLDEVLAAGVRAGQKEVREAETRAQKGGSSPELAAELVVFLASRRSHGLSGKLISAVWDPWREWGKADIDQIMSEPKYNLRRVT